jgi:hypothetical protein
MDTLVVQTVECGILKHHIHSLKSLCIGQELHSFSITNWGTVVTYRLNYFKQFSRSFDLITFSAGREIKGFLVSAKQKDFLAWLRLWWHCRSWPKATRSSDSRCATYFSGDFLKDIYSKNTRILEDLKRNTEQMLPAVSNKLQECFQDILWNWWMFFLKKVENSFSISCNYTFELVYHIICTF